MPVYNGAERLNAAVTRFLAQEFRDFDILIADNASTDGTPDVCTALARSDNRIRFVRHPTNIGALRNFEFVFRHTEGDLFMWLADDDWRCPTFLAKAAEALDRSPVAVLAMSDIETVHQRTGQTGVHSLAEQIRNGPLSQRIRWIYQQGGWGAVYGLIRRNALNNCRVLSELRTVPAHGMSPDYLVIELAAQGPFEIIREPLMGCTARDIIPVEAMRAKLGEFRKVRNTILWWILSDWWNIGRHHNVPLAKRIRVLYEILQAAMSAGSLNSVLRTFNSEGLHAARKAGNWLAIAALLAERAVISQRE
jgi:glycosyltransferase involved in cell wall biosynthesis